MKREPLTFYWSVKCKSCGAHFEVASARVRVPLPDTITYICPYCHKSSDYQVLELEKTR